MRSGEKRVGSGEKRVGSGGKRVGSGAGSGEKRVGRMVHSDCLLRRQHSASHVNEAGTFNKELPLT